MMNKSNPFRHLAVAVFACLMAASCSDVTDDSTALPPGTYPMTFTASVDGLSAPNPASRATTDNTWAGGETVAIQTGGEVKKYTAASGGRLTVAGGADPFYWQSNSETKKVTAWYYGTGYDATPPDGTTWAVQSDQSKTEADNTAGNYRRSDFLYAPATDIPFSGRNSASLSFYHQIARVVVNIVNAEAATDAFAIRSVTIGHAGNLALSGSYTPPTGAGVTAGTWNTSSGSPTMGIITPRRLAALGTLTGGGTALASYAALVIPQQMKGKKFIAVTLANGNTYYYTPTQDGDADLQSGRQHTYDITVKHGYLEVSANTGGSAWGSDGSAEEVNGTKIFNATDLKSGDYYYSDGKTSDGGLRKLHSDGTAAEIEDIGPVLTGADGKDRSVIGIVFWVGDATAKDATLADAHPGCTHGLVVALTDASESTVWQDPYISVQDWLDGNRNGEFLAVESSWGANDPLNNIQGYNNTKAIEAFNGANSGNIVQAVQTVAAYRTQVPAPANSSDWYLPSEKELTLLCGREVDDIWNNNSGGTANRDLINKKLGLINGAVKISSVNYWSSTEYNDYWARGVSFSNGGVGYSFKYDDSFWVRAVLAF